MLRYLAIIGAGILGIIALWVALILVVPAAPPPPTADKVGPAPTAGETPKPREMMARPGLTPAPDPARTAVPPPLPEPTKQVPPPIPAAPIPPEPEPQPQVTPGPEDPPDRQPAAAEAAAPTEPRFPKGSAGCTRYKTYDAQTQTYRGYDGVVRPCRPM